MMELGFKSRLLSPINLDHSITFHALSQRMLKWELVPSKVRHDRSTQSQLLAFSRNKALLRVEEVVVESGRETPPGRVLRQTRRGWALTFKRQTTEEELRYWLLLFPASALSSAWARIPALSPPGRPGAPEAEGGVAAPPDVAPSAAAQCARQSRARAGSGERRGLGESEPPGAGDGEGEGEGGVGPRSTAAAAARARERAQQCGGRRGSPWAAVRPRSRRRRRGSPSPGAGAGGRQRRGRAPEPRRGDRASSPRRRRRPRTGTATTLRRRGSRPAQPREWPRPGPARGADAARLPPARPGRSAGPGAASIFSGGGGGAWPTPGPGPSGASPPVAGAAPGACGRGSAARGRPRPASGGRGGAGRASCHSRRPAPGRGWTSCSREARSHLWDLHFGKMPNRFPVGSGAAGASPSSVGRPLPYRAVRARGIQRWSGARGPLPQGANALVWEIRRVLHK